MALSPRACTGPESHLQEDSLSPRALSMAARGEVDVTDKPDMRAPRSRGWMLPAPAELSAADILRVKNPVLKASSAPTGAGMQPCPPAHGQPPSPPHLRPECCWCCWLLLLQLLLRLLLAYMYETRMSGPFTHINTLTPTRTTHLRQKTIREANEAPRSDEIEQW